MFPLFAGKFWAWHWLDPMMGIVGAGVITKWAHGLIKETSTILLDGSIEKTMREKITQAIESDGNNRISDLHVWRVGPEQYAAILSIVTGNPKTPDHYKELIVEIKKLAHVTVEVIPWQEET